MTRLLPLCLSVALFASAPAFAVEPAPATASVVVVGPLRPGWAGTLRDALQSQAGVSEVKVDTDQRRAEVAYAPKLTNPSQLVAAAREKTGMDVRTLLRATFDVKGELTANCPVLVRKALERLDGVVTVKASLDQAKAWVEYVESATPNQMVDLVKDRAGIELIEVQSKGGGAR